MTNRLIVRSLPPCYHRNRVLSDIVPGLVAIGRPLPLAFAYASIYGIIRLIVGLGAGILLHFTAMVTLMVADLVTD